MIRRTSLVMRFVPILLLAALDANAVGLNLAWNNCYPSSGSAQDQGFTCDDSSPGALDANSKTFTLFGSVIPGFDISGLIAWGATLDWQVANTTLDDWWRLGAGECREGAVSFRYNGFTNSTSCNKQVMATSQAIPVSNWTSEFQETPNEAHFALGAARTTGFAVSGTVEYQLFSISIDTHNTKIEDDGTSVACAGCLDAACIMLTGVELDVPVDQLPPDGKSMITVGDHQQYATWQGGSGASCPTAPSSSNRRPVWGQIKSVLR